MYIQLVKNLKTGAVKATPNVANTYAESVKSRNKATGWNLRVFNKAAFSAHIYKEGQLLHQRYYPEYHEWWNYIRDSENNDEVVMIIASEPFNNTALKKAVRNMKRKEDISD